MSLTSFGRGKTPTLGEWSTTIEIDGDKFAFVVLVVEDKYAISDILVGQDIV